MKLRSGLLLILLGAVGWNWTVSNPLLAAVSPNGLVTGTALGAVTVAGCPLSGGACGSVILTIANVSGGAPSITVFPEQAAIVIGQTLQMSVTGTVATPDWIWTMLDTAVASVSANGRVTALSGGETVLRVCASSMPNLCASANISVR